MSEKNGLLFNEPIAPVEGGYLYDFHYPNIVDFKKQLKWLTIRFSSMQKQLETSP